MKASTKKPDPPFGDKQKAIYESLVKHGSWSVGCGWYWDTHSGTERVMKSLVRRGVVVVKDGVYRPAKATPKRKRAELPAPPLTLKHQADLRTVVGLARSHMDVDGGSTAQRAATDRVAALVGLAPKSSPSMGATVTNGWLLKKLLRAARRCLPHMDALSVTDEDPSVKADYQALSAAIIAAESNAPPRRRKA